MSDDDEQRKREQRKRDLERVSEILAEAVMAHSLTDEESEEAMLAMRLDAEQKRFEKLLDEDPIGAVFHADDDEWIDGALRRVDDSGDE
jgi:hypothetical protein